MSPLSDFPHRTPPKRPVSINACVVISGVLKLADAVEALPSVLDQAAAKDLSMTAALERLLSIEVAATEARRLTGRLRFACLPTPATLEDFDNAAGVDKKLVDEFATCRTWRPRRMCCSSGHPG